MTLYVVATPIGNTEDISLRALDVLKNVDVIAAEDTRKTGRFLSKYDIKKRLISHHEHNERRSAEGVIELMREGSDVALVTNAGTPLISMKCDVSSRHVAGLRTARGFARFGAWEKNAASPAIWK